MGAAECIEQVFPCETSRPGMRTFRRWQALGYIPVHKIGKSTYFDPIEVREALDKRFRSEAE